MTCVSFLSFSRSQISFLECLEKIDQDSDADLLFFEQAEQGTEDKWAVSSISENTQHCSTLAASLKYQSYCYVCYHITLALT